MQRRSASPHFYERVCLHKISPDRRNYAQLTAVVVKPYLTFAIKTTVFQKIKLFATQGMERMCDPYSAAYFWRDGCISVVI
jgi:hypothetical protein